MPECDKKVAQYITKFLEKTDPYAKTIVFCRTINHANRIRLALINENPSRVRENSRYIMKITGDDDIGKAELDNFIDPVLEHYETIGWDGEYPTILLVLQSASIEYRIREYLEKRDFDLGLHILITTKKALLESNETEIWTPYLTEQMLVSLDKSQNPIL